MPSLHEALGSSHLQHNIKQVQEVHACNSNTQEVEGGGSEVQGHPQLHSEFKASLGYIKPYLKIKRRRKEKRVGGVRRGEGKTSVFQIFGFLVCKMGMC